MNIFRPVIKGVLSKKRIKQGGSWRNISFGVDAPIEDYKAHNLYLEVGVKPEISDTQNISEVIEKLDHKNKTVLRTWEVTDKPQEEINIINAAKLETQINSNEKITNELIQLELDKVKDYIDSKIVTADDRQVDFEEIRIILTNLIKLTLAILRTSK